MSGLDSFRHHLDALDEEITRLLGERFEVCREIAVYKRAHAIPMMQPDRVAEVRARYRARGVVLQLPPDFTAALFDLLIGATCRMEDELMESLSDLEIEALPDDELIEAPSVERIQASSADVDPDAA
jgi:4-amino-4-deoxychorismate mutase